MALQLEPKMPSSVDEVMSLRWDELNLVFAMSSASGIRAVVEWGDEAVRLSVEQWTPDVRTPLASALALTAGESRSQGAG